MKNSMKYAIILVGACLLILLGSLVFSGSHSNIKLINNSSENNTKPTENLSQSFFINNWGNKSHEVTVEVLNSQNISMFNKSYILAPKEYGVKIQFPFTLEPGTYVKVTLDNNITKTETISKDFSEGNSAVFIDIDMHPDDPLILGSAIP